MLKVSIDAQLPEHTLYYYMRSGRFSAPKVEISEESSYDAVWPITESKDWCGDFQSDTF